MCPRILSALRNLSKIGTVHRWRSRRRLALSGEQDSVHAEKMSRHGEGFVVGELPAGFGAVDLLQFGQGLG